jgi:hypothetical protein
MKGKGHQMNLNEKLALLNKNTAERNGKYCDISRAEKRISQLTNEIEMPILAERDLDPEDSTMKVMIDDDGIQLRRPTLDGIYQITFIEGRALNKILNELYAEGK